MFIDEVKVTARAGHGGKGCVAFQRDPMKAKGGPIGGNGGRGGDVILQADHDLNNLIAQYYQPRMIAPDGRPGLGKGMDGRAGQDLVVKVPVGTMVWHLPGTAGPGLPLPDQEDDDSPGRRTLRTASSQRPVIRHAGGEIAAEFDLSQPESTAARAGHARGDLVADLTHHGEQFVLCRGGRGGLGNRNFATSRRQTPRFAQPGEPGQEGEYLLELRMIADVGLVGYPNAGKSTLLTAISKARPKIAPYPFTTLHPQIGIVEYPDFFRVTVCDAPGLIQGAHRNVGLGHAFLRHIERCKILVIVLDMAGLDGRLPWDDYHHLIEELQLYDPTLLQRPCRVVANKMDEEAAPENLRKFKRRVRKVPVLPMAAGFDEGIDDFKKLIRESVEAALTTPAAP